MKIYAISDLHLSTNCDKPMDIFGGHWEGYTDKIISNWNAKVSDDSGVFVLIEFLIDVNLGGLKLILKHPEWNTNEVGNL